MEVLSSKKGEIVVSHTHARAFKVFSKGIFYRNVTF
jgi:hypothetical protein